MIGHAYAHPIGFMRVIHVVPAVTVEGSGPTYAVVRLQQAVTEAGVRAEIACLNWNGVSVDGPAVHMFGLGVGPRRLGRSRALAHWLTDEARAGRIQLLHNHGLWMMPNVYPGWLARRFDIPYVVSPRGTLGEWPFNSGSRLKRVFWPLIQRPALAAVTCWHATSQAEYDDIRRMGFQQPVAVIPNGIDVPPALSKEFRQQRTLLYLGRLHPIKGLDWLLRAWAAVEGRFPGWHLRVVGPDERGHLAELAALVRSLGVERVTFDGPLDGSDKWQAYAEAELFVLPTRHENFGLVVAEALAARTPVIVTRNAPWSGVETHGCGWWIEPGVDALVACLEQALACSPERLAAMGQNGRRWVETEFAWPAIGARMAAMYRWLLHASPKPADVVVD